MVQNLHLGRSVKFKLQDYIRAFNDSTEDLKELEESHGTVDLSPNTKLRIIQLKLESKRKLSLKISDTAIDAMDRDIPIFEGAINPPQFKLSNSRLNLRP